MDISNNDIRLFTVDRSKEGYAQIKRIMVSQELINEGQPLSRLWINGRLGGVRQTAKESLMNQEKSYIYLSGAILDLTRVVYEFYNIRPILLIDEYDQPIMSSYEYGYHDELGPFFSNLYGSAMKGNSALGQALLTGVQRVAKESIFSQFNNARVYTVMHRPYSPYFGLTVLETEKILKAYGLVLDEKVQKKYDGYLFGGIEMYNPWSILNYADMGELDNYWVDTSSDYLLRKALKSADRGFW